MKVIAYTRTSTKDQKISHKAQLDAIQTFASNENWIVEKHFSDFASGKDDNREGLLKAIAYANKTRCQVLVLRMDRLGRKLSTLASFLESNIQFVFVEQGMKADKFVLSIMACVAEHEANMISLRTKQALAKLKEQGVQLGNPKMNKVALLGMQRRREQGQETIDRYASIIKVIRSEGITSIRKTAARLEELGIKTPTGKSNWSLRTTSRLIKSQANH